MVEQTRRPSRVVSLQAGPSEADASTPLDVNLRISDRAARVFGSQLALIGDQLNREVRSRQTNWLQNPLQLLRPARALTRNMYRDFHGQLRGFQGLSAAVKAWMASTAPGQGILRAEGAIAWVSGFKHVPCAGWTGGALLAAALLAAVSILSALWTAQKAS